jgi:antagonist of KipI
MLAAKRIQIAVTGGVTSPRINGAKAAMWETLEMQKGDVLSFGKMEAGCRSYLAMRGGVNVPEILGSRSTFARGGFGGFMGRQLKVGDIVHGFDCPLLKAERLVPNDLQPCFTKHYEAHVVLGPQAEMFTEEGVETFHSSPYKVTSEADRMGYRLEGSRIDHHGKAEIISDALLPGAIQVPKNGEPIIMMRDAQTTGGYPKLAVAITPDLSLLGQAKPDDTITFSTVTVQQAQQKTREYLQFITKLPTLLEAKD